MGSLKGARMSEELQETTGCRAHGKLKTPWTKGSVHTEPEQGRWTSRYGWATYTQVPGVQLHLLLQLREQLIVKRLQLGVERKQRSARTYSLREEPNGRGGRPPRQGCPGRWVPPWKRGACLTREPMTLVEPGGPRREC